MSKEEAILKLKECQKNNDTEVAHVYADDVLCDFLKSLGYSDIVSEFHKVDKWYA